mmetsp:Transcript_19188/g.17037  ORF Transcript_19188/g.17037 Transcript_19188/m.17037 type:complete len:97 (-) Transcript_19188:42-332(-)
MQEHNEHHYTRLIKFVQNCGFFCCYCCCKRLVDDAIRYKQDQVVADESTQGKTNAATMDTEETQYETRDDRVEIEHEKYVSEMTIDDRTNKHTADI